MAPSVSDGTADCRRRLITDHPRARDDDRVRRIRVAVLDHQAVFLEALAFTLSAEGDIEVPVTAASVDAVGAADAAAQVDVILVGVDGPRGLSELRRARRRWQGRPVVALDGDGDPAVLSRMLAEGAARHVVLRSDTPQRLVDAVRAAADDQTCRPADVLTPTAPRRR